MTFIPQNNNAIHRKDLGLKDPWAPRRRAEHEALPSTFSIWDRPVYQPPKEHSNRRGAMDFMKVKSLDAADIAAGAATSERPDVRTPAEHVENIRKVLNPPVADLAVLFDVSRQAIYKWLTGTSAPEVAKLGRILELSRIADAFQLAGISRAGTLLKMKTFDGRSLMDLIRFGENRQEHVTALITEATAMESSYKLSGLATSKSKSTSDWKSSISIPGSSERA